MSQEPTEYKTEAPSNDLVQALVWVLLGIATLVGSWRMDRLESQGINPYTAPGLLPALLGVAIVFLGLLLLYRSLARSKGLAADASAWGKASLHDAKRTWVVLGLCLGFAIGLVGRGLPFWAASALFIALAIFVLTPRANEEGFRKGLLLKACVIGLVAGVVISVVFQEFFLVRLP